MNNIIKNENEIKILYDKKKENKLIINNLNKLNIFFKYLYNNVFDNIECIDFKFKNDNPIIILSDILNNCNNLIDLNIINCEIDIDLNNNIHYKLKRLDIWKCNIIFTNIKDNDFINNYFLNHLSLEDLLIIEFTLECKNNDDYDYDNIDININNNNLLNFLCIAISNYKINLNISNCNNLKDISLSNECCSSLYFNINLNNLSNVKYLQLCDNDEYFYIKDINIKDCPNLTYIYGISDIHYPNNINISNTNLDFVFIPIEERIYNINEINNILNNIHINTIDDITFKLSNCIFDENDFDIQFDDVNEENIIKNEINNIKYVFEIEDENVRRKKLKLLEDYILQHIKPNLQ